MEPVAVGELVPAQSLPGPAHAELVAESSRLCRSFHVMGHRGYLSTDAILTPEGDIVFTETNGRMSGSTHLHRVIRDRLLTPADRTFTTGHDADDQPVSRTYAADARKP